MAGKSNGTTSRMLRGLVGVACFVLFWQAVPELGLADPYYLPPPTEVAVALAGLVSGPSFWPAVGNTLLTWSFGLVIALAIGGLAGIAIGTFPALRALTASTIEFLRPIPSVALIPLVVLLLGTGRPATLVLVVYASMWQVLVQMSYGVQDVDPIARGTASVYRFSPWSVVRHVIWPTALPYAVTGFRLAAAVALMLTITGELLIGTPGLGRLIVQAQSAGHFPDVYALIVVAGLLGLIVNLLTRRCERHVLSWHPSVRSEAL